MFGTWTAQHIYKRTAHRRCKTVVDAYCFMFAFFKIGLGLRYSKKQTKKTGHFEVYAEDKEGFHFIQHHSDSNRP